MRVRVLTYNIHKCVGGLDRRLDPARVAETIAHYAPDVVLLQEAHSGDGAPNQADWLGERLGLRHRAYLPNVPRGAGRYGNAILSRFPIAAVSHVDLTVPLKKRRTVVHARLRVREPGVRGRTLNVYNLHLGLSGIERRIQLERFLLSHPFARLHHRAAIVVAGDFNDVWGTLGPKVLVPAGFRGWAEPPPTFPAFAPVRALDSLYVRGDVTLERLWPGRSQLSSRASDHLPVVAELRLRPAPEHGSF